MAMLELVELRKQFGELVAVNDINLSIEKGELRGLIGPNGSGKTTLFSLITGFMRPTKGEVLWEGHDITQKPPHSRAEIGIVRTFQITTLFKEMTALQNVIMAYHLHTEMGLLKQFFGTRATRERERFLEQKALGVLETLGIADVRGEIVKNLPHGHQEALALAIAMATEPKLLLLDEPVTGMNHVETRDMMKRIRMLNEQGITILLVEHDMRAVMGICRKLTVVNFGQRIAEGSPEEIMNNKDVVEAYLGVGGR